MSFSLIEDELEKLITDKMNLLECRHSIYLNLNVGLEIHGIRRFTNAIRESAHSVKKDPDSI